MPLFAILPAPRCLEGRDLLGRRSATGSGQCLDLFPDTLMHQLDGLGSVDGDDALGILLGKLVITCFDALEKRSVRSLETVFLSFHPIDRPGFDVVIR